MQIYNCPFATRHKEQFSCGRRSASALLSESWHKLFHVSTVHFGWPTNNSTEALYSLTLWPQGAKRNRGSVSLEV